MTPDRLALAFPRAPTEWLEAACILCDGWGVNSKPRQAAFMGQLAHESTEFTRMVENLRYTDANRIALIFRKKFDVNGDNAISMQELAVAQRFVGKPEDLANFVYAGRNGNGPMMTGDGWRYRGRGPIQITGRDNYRDFGYALKFDALANPDDLLLPTRGMQSALWFWTTRGLNAYADKGDHETITRRINGGLNGLAERLVYINKAMGVLT